LERKKFFPEVGSYCFPHIAPIPRVLYREKGTGPSFGRSLLVVSLKGGEDIKKREQSGGKVLSQHVLQKRLWGTGCRCERDGWKGKREMFITCLASHQQVMLTTPPENQEKGHEEGKKGRDCQYKKN